MTRVQKNAKTELSESESEILLLGMRGVYGPKFRPKFANVFALDYFRDPWYVGE